MPPCLLWSSATTAARGRGSLTRIESIRLSPALAGIDASNASATRRPKQAHREMCFIISLSSPRKVPSGIGWPLFERAQEADCMSLSIGSICPEIDFPASDAKNTARAAMSRGSTSAQAGEARCSTSGTASG